MISGDGVRPLTKRPWEPRLAAGGAAAPAVNRVDTTGLHNGIAFGPQPLDLAQLSRRSQRREYTGGPATVNK